MLINIDETKILKTESLNNLFKSAALKGINENCKILHTDFYLDSFNYIPITNINNTFVNLFKREDDNSLNHFYTKNFYNNFKNLGIETNFSYGNFLLVNFNRIRGNSKKIFLKLAKSGILVRKMDVYKIKNSLRITIGNNLENKKFIKTLRKII